MRIMSDELVEKARLDDVEMVAALLPHYPVDIVPACVTEKTVAIANAQLSKALYAVVDWLRDGLDNDHAPFIGMLLEGALQDAGLEKPE